MDFSLSNTPPASGTEAGDIRLFSAWSDDNWAKLIPYTQSRRFSAGEVLLRAGEYDRTLYIVMDGSLEVLALGPQATVVATVPTGSILGEQAFMDGQPRSAHVRAQTGGELVSLSPEYFDAFAFGYPELALAFLYDLGRILSLKLRATTSMVHEAGGQAAQRPPVHADTLPPAQRVDLDKVARARAAAQSPDSELLQRIDDRLKELRRQHRI